MYKRVITIIATGLFVFSGIAQKNEDMKLETLKDSASYSIGVSIANNLKQQGITEINTEALAKAIGDVFGGSTPDIHPSEMQTVIQEFMNAEKEKKYAANKEAGEKFLAENAKRNGVTVLPSGLQYEVITAGEGPKPTPQSRVKVHYTGTLTDGTIFDSSVERGQPAVFGVTQVIKGWTEALQLMPVGSKWKLYIPQDLAYGANPHPGGKIQPYDALIFEVELISIEQ